jgi:hypothetical protein
MAELVGSTTPRALERGICGLARPAGLEPAIPGLEGRGYEATGGSVEPLLPFFLRFSHTRDDPDQPAAATDCQSFVSRLASFRNSRSRDTRTSWLDDDECAGDPIAKFCSDIDESLTERASHFCWEPNQDNSSGLASTRVREQTEVLVFSQKYSSFGTGQREDDFVINARVDLCDRRGVVASVAEGFDDCEVAALVGEEPHRLVSALGGPFVDEDNLFVRQRVGSVAHGRLDVLALQGRIAIEEVRFRSTFTQLAKDQLDGNPRSANYRLAEHHPRIDLDPVCECHATPLSRIYPAAEAGPALCIEATRRLARIRCSSILWPL